MSYKQTYKKKKYIQFDQTSVSHQILRLLLGKDLGGVKDDGLNTAGVLLDGFLCIKLNKK
jgi:hypothetical protein